MEPLQLTVSVDRATGRASLVGPLDDRETCLKLVAEALRLLLTMPQKKPGEVPAGILAPPAGLVGELARPAATRSP